MPFMYINHDPAAFLYVQFLMLHQMFSLFLAYCNTKNPSLYKAFGLQFLADLG